MIDVLLNATRLALSKDTRASVSTIIELIRRSPEWQRDICRLEARVERTHREHAALLGGLTAAKLANLGYEAEAVSSFQGAFGEMTANAFDHGCSWRQSIGVTIEISSVYVSATVQNGRWHNFDLNLILERSRKELAANPKRRRGRGLILVAELSDSLEYIEPRSIKAVFYSDRVETEVLKLRGLVVLTLKYGMTNPSLFRRLFDATSRALSETDVVLDISGVERRGETKGRVTRQVSTAAETEIIELQDVAENVGRKLVMKVAHQQEVPADFLRDAGVTVTTSWAEISKLLGRKSLPQELYFARQKSS